MIMKKRFSWTRSTGVMLKDGRAVLVTAQMKMVKNKNGFVFNPISVKYHLETGEAVKFNDLTSIGKGVLSL